MTPSPGSTTRRAHIVTGLFNDRESADRAYQSLLDWGMKEENISVLMSNATHTKYRRLKTPADTGNKDDKMMEGAGIGAAVGGTTGALLAMIAAIGAPIVLPGIGLIVAGPLATLLAGAGAGGLTGGLVGALVGSGVPEDNAKAFEEGIKAGGIVLIVKTQSQQEAKIIEREWRSYGSECVYC